MPESKGKHDLLFWGVVGLLGLGAIALLVRSQSSNTSLPGGSVQALNAIEGANIAATQAQASNVNEMIKGGVDLEKTIVGANTAIQLNYQNNSTALSVANGSNTLALDEATILGEVARGQQAVQLATAQGAQATAAQISGNQTRAQQTTSNNNFWSSIANSIIGGAKMFFGGGAGASSNAVATAPNVLGKSA